MIEPNAGSVAEGINAGGVARTIDELDIKKEKDESPARLYCEEMVIDEGREIFVLEFIPYLIDMVAILTVFLRFLLILKVDAL